MRFDLKVVASWIAPEAEVLDLGCGSGDLMAHLKSAKNAACVGIELCEDKAAECVGRGLSVLHGDINTEIRDFPDDSFDFVILSQTLQQVYDPAGLIREMLRVGKKGIVSFPNFAHHRVRMQLLLSGRAPVSRELPFQWFDTPNIRVITIKDFRRFCRANSFAILDETAISTHHHESEGRVVERLPNLLAAFGIFLLGRG